MSQPCYQRVMYTLGSVIMAIAIMHVKRGATSLTPDPNVHFLVSDT